MGGKMMFQIKQEFWTYYQDLVADVMLPYQYQVLNDEVEDPAIEKSHSLENFRIAAGESQGDFYGCAFQDSDTAKWLEAVAYSLKKKLNADLEQKADEVIALVERAQKDDGYLDSFITVAHPEMRFQNLSDWHELYCMGHMIEAGVAYYEATGKRRLLDVVCRIADLLCETFGPEKKMGCPGHPEVELALIRLWRVTDEKKYLKLAGYFLDIRGTDPDFFKKEAKKRGDENTTSWVTVNSSYAQNHLPVREQTEATGHAVRAVYLYTGMAMMAKETGDPELEKACERLWDNITQKRMYVTGGIGACQYGEAFSEDYDLPNGIAYCETCASIGLMFFAKAMLELETDAKYADVMELALYNTVLDGMQRTGKRFLYTNPLEINPVWAEKSPNYRLIAPERFKWHSCACCPPNLARLLAGLDSYVWQEKEGILYDNLFIGGTYRTKDAVQIAVKTEYPYGDTVAYTVQGGNVTLAFRIPVWSEKIEVKRNGKTVLYESLNGYGKVELQDGDEMVLTVDMTPHRVYANPNVTADEGRCALMAGPLVYCLEDADNGGDITGLAIDGAAVPEGKRMQSPELGDMIALHIAGVRKVQTSQLYMTKRPEKTPVKLTAIPFYAHGNRQSGKMRVWIPEE